MIKVPTNELAPNKMMYNGSKAVWRISENSSILGSLQWDRRFALLINCKKKICKQGESSELNRGVFLLHHFAEQHTLTGCSRFGLFPGDFPAHQLTLSAPVRTPLDLGKQKRHERNFRKDGVGESRCHRCDSPSCFMI